MFEEITAFGSRDSAKSAPNRGRPPAQERSEPSSRLGFELGKVGVQLVFRNTLAPVKLFDATPHPGIDRGFDLQQPAILFFLRFEQAEQGFLCARGARRLDRLWTRASKALSLISMFIGVSCPLIF